MENIPTLHRHRINHLKVRWPAWVALLAVAVLYEALPKSLYWGPRGLMSGVVGIMIIPLFVTQWRNYLRLNRILGLGVNILITLYMIISIVRIVAAVLHGYIGPGNLLFSSMALWGTNILVFALWYWNLDAGGPNRRELQEGTWFGAFFFPQMQISLSQDKNMPASIRNWQANFIDYLFIAFNTSTAFSPTDTPVLTQWAKLMSMIQALISLTIVVMLAAKAISLIEPAEVFLH
jgi:hypothetical protein